MRRVMMWALYVVPMAVALYFVGLAGIPFGVMKMVQSRIGGLSGKNTMIHAERPSHTSRAVVRPSPELLYSICSFDLSQGPLHVMSGAPNGTYWSVAFYRDNTDNFFVVNDKGTGGARADVILYSAEQMAAGKDAFDTRYKIAGNAALSSAVGVESPSLTGLVLIRTLINDEARLPEIDAERRMGTCGSLTP